MGLLTLQNTSFKRYIALLSQNGINAPVATVLLNEIGNIVWTRQAQGVYRGTLTGAFPAGKCFVNLTNPYQNLAGDIYQATSTFGTNFITVSTYIADLASDGVLGFVMKQCIEVMVFN